MKLWELAKIPQKFWLPHKKKKKTKKKELLEGVAKIFEEFQPP